MGSCQRKADTLVFVTAAPAALLRLGVTGKQVSHRARVKIKLTHTVKISSESIHLYSSTNKGAVSYSEKCTCLRRITASMLLHATLSFRNDHPATLRLAPLSPPSPRPRH